MRVSSDGERLLIGMLMEDQCILRYLEMAEAFEAVDVDRASEFAAMARQERAHRDRLTSAWIREGSPGLRTADVLAWIVEHHPDVMELWDRDDADLARAWDQLRAIEREAQLFYRSAARSARSASARALFAELAAEEAAHAA